MSPQSVVVGVAVLTLSVASPTHAGAPPAYVTATVDPTRTPAAPLIEDLAAPFDAVPSASPAMAAVPSAEAGPAMEQARAPVTTRDTTSAAVVEIEAEMLTATTKHEVQGGRVVVQDMKGFGPSWSGGAQLFWTGGRTGATLDLFVDIPQDGAWVVELYLTRAPDFAQLQFEVDQHPVDKWFDGYARTVEGPAPVLLGSFAMRAGSRRVSLMIRGKQHSSTGWLVGLDRIRLYRTSGQ